MNLTAKQQRFAQEYLLDSNATQAAIRAGYSKKTAYSQGQRLLKHVEIRKAVGEKRQALSEKTEITIEAAISTLWDSAHRCLQLKPVLNSDGQPIIVDVPDDLIPVYGDTVAAMVKHNPAAAHKALEIILRHLGAFTSKFEVTGKDGEPLKTGLSDIELKQRVLSILLRDDEDKS